MSEKIWYKNLYRIQIWKLVANISLKRIPAYLSHQSLLWSKASGSLTNRVNSTVGIFLLSPTSRIDSVVREDEQQTLCTKVVRFFGWAAAVSNLYAIYYCEHLQGSKLEFVEKGPSILEKILGLEEKILQHPPNSAYPVLLFRLCSI